LIFTLKDLSFHASQESERKLIEKGPSLLEKTVQEVMILRQRDDVAEECKEPIACIDFYLDLLKAQMLKDIS
jgi:hypothetical protein